MPETDFELAKQVSAAATWIDENKPSHLGHHRVEAIKHIAFLQQLAEKLAGDHLEELYTEE